MTDLLHAETRGVYSRKQMTAVFYLVADPDNWKNPIDCRVAVPKELKRTQFIDMVTDAVIFFTGSKPTIIYSPVSDTVKVQADGYYRAIGA